MQASHSVREINRRARARSKKKAARLLLFSED